MVTFCTGNSFVKRQAFRNANGGDTVSVDNDEVLASFSLEGRLYVAVGTVPYADMTVEQYIACTRALISFKPLNRYKAKELLSLSGLSINIRRKMFSLNRIEFRAVSLAARLQSDTRTIYLNFDSLEYTRRNAKALKSFVYRLSKNYEVFVAVSDTRFIPSNSPSINYTTNGIENVKVQMRSKTTSSWRLRRRLARNGMDIILPKIESVVVCEG